jgi:conjugative transfer signal peptidase TraF
MALGMTVALLPMVWTTSTIHYLWNASGSVPVGLYRLRPASELAATELVVVGPPEPLATFLNERGYLPRGIPMLKRIAALPGQTVCRDRLSITVDEIEIGMARERDSRDRPLAVWQGCHLIEDGEVFLMNWQSTDSLDGRYFGVLPMNTVMARAEPLWTDEGR